MAVYLYQHPITKKIIEVIQSTKDKHEYIDSEGVEYERVWTIPQASFNSKIDPFSSGSFVEKTRGKKLSLGDMWDMSAEMSDKRKDKEGIDNIKKNYNEKEQKRRNGKRLSQSDAREKKKI